MRISISHTPDAEHPLRLGPTSVVVDGVPLSQVCSAYRLEHHAGEVPTLDFTLNFHGIDLGCEQRGQFGKVSVAGLGEVRSILMADGRVLAGAAEVFAALSEHWSRRHDLPPDQQMWPPEFAATDAALSAGMRELARHGDPVLGESPVASAALELGPGGRVDGVPLADPDPDKDP